MRRYQEAAFRAAFLVLRDAAEAEDAAQDGMVKAYRAIRTFRRGHEFRPWLLRIVVNQSLTTVRSRRRRTAATERLAVHEQPLPHTLDETIIDRERARLVWAALDSLREQERVVVYLRYFLNLPERELAEYLGLRAGHREIAPAPRAAQAARGGRPTLPGAVGRVELMQADAPERRSIAWNTTYSCSARPWPSR